ncbi:MAG: putative rane protein [Nevskia sp.]|nr:putative rane protein [Nevskia sp.]
MSIAVTAATTAVCALLLAGLAARISLLRIRLKVMLGDGGQPQLLRAIRAHGNTIEHVPIYLLTSLCYEAYAGANPLLVALDALFVVARLLLAWGLSRGSINLPRRLGATLTLGCELGLGGLLLWTVARAL